MQYDSQIFHKKSLGKNTLMKHIINGRFSTESYCGSFYHYTSPEGLMGY